MRGPIDNISSQIIKSAMVSEKMAEVENEDIESHVKEAIIDLKEEIGVYSEGLNAKALRRTNQKEEKSSPLLEEHHAHEEEQSNTQKIQRQGGEFDQQAQFLTKDQKKELGKMPDELAAATASLLEEENIKKKKKLDTSKSKLEEKLEFFSTLEDDFKNLNLKPEDRELVEGFFGNLARIKNLKTRLKQLTYLEEKYEEEEKTKELAKKNENPNKQKGFFPGGLFKK